MDIKDVENLAALARLELADDEKQEILKDMEGILNYVKQIEAVEVDNVDNGISLYNAWREDKETNRSFSAEIIKEQFPDAQDGFLKVKKIL